MAPWMNLSSRGFVLPTSVKKGAVLTSTKSVISLRGPMKQNVLLRNLFLFFFQFRALVQINRQALCRLHRRHVSTLTRARSVSR